MLQYLFYRIVRTALGTVAVFVFHLRCLGRENTHVPGGALILSTQQSHFDPALVGLTINDHRNFLAKRSLFEIGCLVGLL